MAFKAFLIAALVAVASAGMSYEYMQMMDAYNKMQEQQHVIPREGDCKNGKCAIPQGVDVGAYIQSQKDEMRYKEEKLNADIKAQFESVMAEVNAKKHKYAMGIMTEYTAMCACLDESNSVYDSVFIPSAAARNMTDTINMPLPSELPYEADSLKEAKSRIFAGLVRSTCNSLKSYLNFAETVDQQLTILQGV